MGVAAASLLYTHARALSKARKVHIHNSEVSFHLLQSRNATGLDWTSLSRTRTDHNAQRRSQASAMHAQVGHKLSSTEAGGQPTQLHTYEYTSHGPPIHIGGSYSAGLHSRAIHHGRETAGT